MKKQVKRIVAIVAALAMVVTSMAFTPTKVSARTDVSTHNVQPNSGTAGLWDYSIVPYYDWGGSDVNAYVDYEDTIEGFEYHKNSYSWDASTFTSANVVPYCTDSNGNPLVSGKSYKMTVKITVNLGETPNKPFCMSLATQSGSTNLNEEQIEQSCTSGTDKEYIWADKVVVPSNKGIKLAIKYGVGKDGCSGSTKGQMELTEVTFESTETTTEAGVAHIVAPEGDAQENYGKAEQTVGLWDCTVISGYEASGPWYWAVESTVRDFDAIQGFSATTDKFSFPGAYYKGNMDSLLEADTTYDCTVVVSISSTQKNTNPDSPNYNKYEYSDVSVGTSGGATNMTITTQSTSATDDGAAQTKTFTGKVKKSGNRDATQLVIGVGNDGGDNGTGGYPGTMTVQSVTLTEEVTTSVEPTTAAPGTGTIVAPAGNDHSDPYNDTESTIDLWTGTVMSGWQDNTSQGIPDYFWDVTATLTGADAINGFSVSLSDYSFPGSYWKGNLSGYNLTAGTSYNCTVTLVETTTDSGGQYAPITVQTSGFTEDLAKSTKSTGGTMTWTGVVKAGADTPYLNIGYGNDGAEQGLGGYAGGFTVQSVTFEAIVDPYTAVPRNTEDYHPDNNNNNPWALTVLHVEPASWGDMSYLVDGTASNVANTSIRIDNVAHDDASQGVDQSDPSDWWWYNGGKINNYYDTSQWTVGKGYTGSFTFNYTAPDPATQYAKKIRVIYDGNVIVEPVSAGTNTINLPEISYNGTLPTIEFNFDLLEKGSIISVSDVSFTLTNDWNWQDDSQVSLQTIQNKSTGGSGTSTLNWTLYSATQSGEGCKLFYKTETDQQTGLKDVKVKVGEGNRWDPICAQFNVSNSSAYHDLTANTTYYMTYKFNSTAAGTVHFTQEGYPPNAIERFDVVAGENTYTKVMTYMPNQDTGNIKMSLTPTTYADGGTVVQDGTPLPVDTILSDFEITFSRQDDEGWTIVTDSREASQGSQVYDTLVPNLTAYTNSNYGGRLSYKTNDYDLGEDAIAKTSIRVDNLPGSTFTNTTWPASMRIPNNYFYNRTDTNGDPLVDGDQYTLRFFMNVDLPDGVSSGTVYFKQEGYDDEHAYTVTDGLNMLGGTIQAKSGYTSHDNYDKTGGISMTYDADKTTTTQEYNTQVVFDLSEMPNGAIINDVSWEFYADPPAATYNVSIDGTKVAEVQPGGSYTLPTGQGAATVGYLIDGAQGADQVVYKPGATKSNIQSDINFISVNSVTSQVAEGAAMKLDNEDKRGIAFQGTFKVNNATTNIDTDAFTTGMLIATETCFTDQCEEVLDLDKAALYPNGIVNVVNGAGDTQKWLTGKPGQYRAGIINIADQNITRNFISRAYYTINYSDGTSETHYSEGYSLVRSIQQVATLVKADQDYYNKLTEGQRAIVDYCADYTN